MIIKTAFGPGKLRLSMPAFFPRDEGERSDIEIQNGAVENLLSAWAAAFWTIYCF